MKDERDLRSSPIGGDWYAGDARNLAATVDGYLAAAGTPAVDGALVALVAPHAGHRYSGAVAGYAFAAARGLVPDVVAVVGPMHSPSSGTVLTSGHRAYATPLGVVPIDADARHTLEDHVGREAGVRLVPVRNDDEHSVEIELPFLQRALAREFRLLPVMVRDERPAVIRGLGQALAKALEGRTALLVASTDLSHYYPQARAEAFDAEMLRRVEALDPGGVLSAEDERAGFACGSAALAAVLWAARALGADRARVLRHATSGDVTGDYDRVVGYGAAVVTRRGAAGTMSR
ncbi:MAG: AmmeMemoRadiSam system protein B [Candidatus Rokubacteria bacterium]|nr:AmmeMemoRadiSam system protein B [Candidatus Rokubacteria bacterium]